MPISSLGYSTCPCLWPVLFRLYYMIALLDRRSRGNFLEFIWQIRGNSDRTSAIRVRRYLEQIVVT